MTKRAVSTVRLIPLKRRPAVWFLPPVCFVLSQAYYANSYLFPFTSSQTIAMFEKPSQALSQILNVLNSQKGVLVILTN